jgi:nitroreductase/Pyruvate/2-oxoacid:ferredoxin oxidoreductase delta subunit
MPILGIDYEKCINCKLCVKECARRYIEDAENDRVIFQDPTGTCSSCGHCIAVCPENAILYEGFKDEPYTFDGIEHPETIASYETVYNLIRTHRSIRHYKKDKVPDDVLRKVINTMQYAPTAGNMRSENFAIISDEIRIKTLSEAVMEELLKNPGGKARYEESFEIRKKMYANPVYFDAPHVIIVFSTQSGIFEWINMGILVTYGRIAAQALGLGTCWNGWTTMAFESNRKLVRLAGVRGVSWCAFTIGYPNIKFKRCPPRAHKRIKML